MIELAQSRPGQKLENGSHPSLEINLLGTYSNAGFGAATLFTLGQHIRQGDYLLKNPEMTFMMIDGRQHADGYEFVVATPCRFINEAVDVFEDSIEFQNDSDGMAINELDLHRKHIAFAENWLEKLEGQGFLDPF
ncbi:hypothetical protein DF947_17665 [Pedobacter paludis]|uniref:DUF6908 domain-containing protein n=1 Tax=Pedobacter paludis TaxID=2203212 RepID=A0A317EWC2_9SPHI|nr:hypothetical protein DF947_17665 [Pedobacter paludis]